MAEMPNLAQVTNHTKHCNILVNVIEYWIVTYQSLLSTQIDLYLDRLQELKFNGIRRWTSEMRVTFSPLRFFSEPLGVVLWN